MGTSVSLVRFVGLQIEEDLADAICDYDNDFIEIGGVKLFIYAGPDSEGQRYIVRADAQSPCEFSHSRWDGHGGGAESFDFYADPLTEEQQLKFNKHDRDKLLELWESIQVYLDKLEADNGDTFSRPDKNGIVLAFGWMDAWPDTYVPIRRSNHIVSYGPWPVGDGDDVMTDYYGREVISSPDSVIVPPYGRETIPGRAVIPVQTEETAVRLYNAYMQATFG